MSDHWLLAMVVMLNEVSSFVFIILLNKYGGARIEEASYSTKDIYECVDTWVSQGNKISHGIEPYFKTYFSNTT